MSEQLTGCHPPHLLLLRPSTASTPPQSFIVSLSGSLGELVLCVCVCARCVCVCVCVCVFVAADQRQLGGGGGGGGGGGRWYLVPPPTSPPLCICPSQFEQRVFFFCLPPSSSSSSLLFYPLIDSERASEEGKEQERKREREREIHTAIPSQRAQLFCYSGVNQVDAYCCRYRFVCVHVCVFE